MAANDESASSKEDSVLPDERAVLADRVPDLEELDEEDYLSVDELADELDIDRD